MPPLPINREDGGQTQLQEQNGVVSAVPQPTYPAINIPDVITPDFFNRPPSADRQRIENDLQTKRQEYMTSFQQTQREQQLQQETGDLETQLTNLRQSEAKGQFNIEQQRIAMPLITGQQAALQRQAQLERGDVLAQLESKQRSLGFEVAKREGIMAKAKAAVGFAESDLDRIEKVEKNQFEREKAILDYSQKLGDNARQTLGTILSKFEGMGWNDLTEESRTGLANLAAQAGIEPFIVAEGLETQKDSMLLKQEKDILEMGKLKKEIGLPAKLETSITEAGGRRLLINDQTGKVIKDLGVSELPKAGGDGGLTTAQMQTTINQIVGSFDNEQVVKNYNIVSEGYQFAKDLGTKKTPTSSDDQGLIYAFAKAMDPNSVVREGEYATVQKYAQSWAESFGFKAERIFSNTVFLTKEARQNMIDTIKSKFSVSEKNYQNVSKEYQRRIEDVKLGKVGGSITDYSKAFQDNVVEPTGDLSSVSNQDFLQSIPTFGPTAQTDNKSFFGGIYNWLTGK